jgi:hypothetical protein
MILEPPRDVPIFDGDAIEAVHERRGQLMQRIRSNVSDPDATPSDPALRLDLVLGPRMRIPLGMDRSGFSPVRTLAASIWRLPCSDSRRSCF